MPPDNVNVEVWLDGALYPDVAPPARLDDLDDQIDTDNTARTNVPASRWGCPATGPRAYGAIRDADRPARRPSDGAGFGDRPASVRDGACKNP